MSDLKKKLASAAAAAGLLAYTALPALATTIEISGNGSESENDAEVAIEQNTTVVQSNEAEFENNIEAAAISGGNEANGNTGGAVEIDTGDADTIVTVENKANKNVAEVDCCDTDGVDVLISDNGESSENDVDLDLKRDILVAQENDADIDNNVHAFSGTGANEAEDNTNGDVEIETGDAFTGVAISNEANSNSALVSGAEGDGWIGAWIVGNGSDSDNDIELDIDKLTTLVQSNEAEVENNVSAFAGTGKNEAEDNTGGSVEIDTGDAMTEVVIDNMLNFNWADVDCGCTGSIWAKIAGNGEDSENDIYAEVLSDLAVFQDNCGGEGYQGDWYGEYDDDCELENNVHAKAKTGKNEASDNTEGEDGDPEVDTGDASVGVAVENTSNANVYGESAGFDLDLPFGLGLNLNITLDMDDILDALEDLLG